MLTVVSSHLPVAELVTDPECDYDLSLSTKETATKILMRAVDIVKKS